jgi:D-inositol-3-phosphate glycosyltransferase
VFGRQAIRRANDLFTWRHVAGGVAAIYEDVLAAGDPRRRAQAGHLAVVDHGFDEIFQALQESKRRLRGPIAEAADVVAECFAAGGKMLVCGNGGSAAQAQHLAGELVGRFRLSERRALPVVALTADSTVVTAWANDAGYDDVFARQVEALGRTGDVLVALSTSGRSPNVLRALQAARRQGVRAIGLLGRDGGRAQPLVDVAITVPSQDTPRIQEMHLVAVHLLCELVESRVAAGAGGRAPEEPRTRWERFGLRASRARAA